MRIAHDRLKNREIGEHMPSSEVKVLILEQLSAPLNLIDVEVWQWRESWRESMSILMKVSEGITQVSVSVFSVEGL